MGNSLKQYTADHRYLLDAVARRAGFASPVAIDLDEFYAPLLKAARKRELLPIDGVLVRDWDPDNRSLQPGIQLGMRLYEIEGVRFVKVRFAYSDQPSLWGLDFVAVDRKDYRRLYKIALRCRRDFEPSGKPPVLHGDQAEVLWKNTIGYLEPANLRRIKAYGGRPKRGVLLMGPPGNGKTTACRWIWEECRRRNWQWRLVSPDSYQQARHSCNPQEAVRELFSVEGRGIVFFDDMDLALRDRETVHETDDQAVFLGALDGISVQEGVVFVFTTNCAPELIDRAFKRPGRLDLVLHFKAPDAAMRRQLIDRWHEDIRSQVDMEIIVSSTEGYSFAEIEELKNLLIMHYVDAGTWDWSWALDQFEANRKELANGQRRRVGFASHQQEGARGIVKIGNGSK
jgi:adenylate kinase family enzyme